MTLYDFIYYGAQTFTTLFVLGVTAVILESSEDDDDDQDGGILQPCYVTNK